MISSLSGSAFRRHVESLSKPRDVNKRSQSLSINLISKQTHLVLSIYQPNHLLYQQNTLKDQTMLLTSASDIHASSSSRSGSLGDGNLTGMVGTALYVSPEMMSGENKVTYSQVSLVVLVMVT